MMFSRFGEKFLNTEHFEVSSFRFHRSLSRTRRVLTWQAIYLRSIKICVSGTVTRRKWSFNVAIQWEHSPLSMFETLTERRQVNRIFPSQVVLQPIGRFGFPIWGILEAYELDYKSATAKSSQCVSLCYLGDHVLWPGIVSLRITPYYGLGSRIL